MVVGRLVSFWEGPFWGAMLVLGRVTSSNFNGSDVVVFSDKLDILIRLLLQDLPGLEQMKFWQGLWKMPNTLGKVAVRGGGLTRQMIATKPPGTVTSNSGDCKGIPLKWHWFRFRNYSILPSSMNSFFRAEMRALSIFLKLSMLWLDVCVTCPYYWICLRWFSFVWVRLFFTFYHGRSPLNHHLGNIFFFQPPQANLSCLLCTMGEYLVFCPHILSKSKYCVFDF